MIQRTKTDEPISKQVKRKIRAPKEKKETEYPDGDFGTIISTGSTLSDLAISGGRILGGGIPGGIFMEVFGPESSGKSALLCEIGGNIQRKGGLVQYHDPESRIDHQFSQMFGISIDDKNYHQPDTVTQVFKAIDEWKPEPNDKRIHGIITDSLAALSTDMEMEKKEGDKMGGRRGKEFSEGFRKAARLIKSNNYLLVCSNQLRDTFAKFGKKEESPGGHAIKFYASLRTTTRILKYITKTIIVHGKEVERAMGVNIEIKVVKSSVWEPLRTAPITILFKYGIDDIRQNLQYIKDYTSNTVYTLGENKLGKGIEESIKMIEDGGLEKELREQVIDLWESIEEKSKVARKPKS